MLSSQSFKISRRHLLITTAGASTQLALPALAQQKFPNRPITLVVPFPPGGSVDNAARAISAPLSRVLGQPVIVENKAGAGGSIGSAAVAKAPPDGYTLVVTSQSTHVINPAVAPKLPYDAVSDFAPITLIERLAMVLLVNASLPVNSFEEFVAYVKARPGHLNYASAGNGSTAHLHMEMLKSKLGLSIAHVPYRGAGPALNDLLAGQVEVTWNNLTSNLNMIEQGKLKALAVASMTRTPQLPTIPTFAELNLPALNQTNWSGLAAPAKTPEPIVQALYEAVRKVMHESGTEKAWVKRGALVPEDLKPAAYQQEIIQRIKFYGDAARANKVVMD